MAMQYLHSFDPPIIHRDLKSLNLLLENAVSNEHPSRPPVVKLCDFGFARIVGDRAARAAMMTNAAGTFHWMAPEVYMGTTYDEKADVFSFAMIMYEAIFRKVPYEDLDPDTACNHFANGLRPTFTPEDREVPEP